MSLYYRRDCPEIIEAQSAISNSVTYGVDTWSAWDQQVASLGYDGILVAASVAYRQRVTSTTNGSAVLRQRCWTGIGTGGAGSETEIARTMFGMGMLGALAGVVDDAVTGTADAPALAQMRITPRYIESGTRVAVRGYQTGDSANAAKRHYLVFYNAALLRGSLRSIPWIDPRRWVEGNHDHQSDDLPDTAEISPTSGTGAPWTFGSYTDVSSSLDADYLIEGISWSQEAEADVIAEVAVGAAGSEVVQARAGFPCNIGVNQAWSPSLPFDFRIPCIAYKGERLAVRVATESVSAFTTPFRFQATKLT
jgi:hypothetical protein